MKTLTIRGLDDEIFEMFKRRAGEHERNPEAHARFLILQESRQGGQVEMAGELIETMWARPAIPVSPEKIDAFQAARGRRSHRP